jgi:hypothetical protein
MRFLTDHLNGDVYFRIHRPNHNLDRCRAQFRMVAEMERQLGRMNEIVSRYRGVERETPNVKRQTSNVKREA